MKKLSVALVALFLCGTTCTSFAQTSTKELMKARKELQKASKEQLNQRSSKAARKEAKALAKQGWMVAPGALPLEKQLERSYTMEYEINDDLTPKYIMGAAMSIGEHYDAARKQALQLAVEDLASKIVNEVTILVENSVANKQLTNEQAASITQTLSESKGLVSQRIGRTVVVTEAYRVKENTNKEVMIRIAYSSQQALDAAKEVARQEMAKSGGSAVW